MKKLFILLAILCITITQANAARTTFANAYSQNDRKPMMVLVYAKWADGYQDVVAQFRKAQQKYGDTYNYVELDIATPDAKFYSDRFMITCGLPYIMLFRNNCKMSKIIDKDCASSLSCIKSKVDTFIN